MIAVDEISHEYIYHGGCLLTRLEVYRLESVEGRPEVGIGSADWWAFSKPAAACERTQANLQTQTRRQAVQS